MPRVKRGVTARARHKKVLQQARGFRGRRGNVYRVAKQAVMKAGQYAYRGKSGELSGFRATLGSLSPEDRRVAGAAFNAAKERIEAALEARRTALAGAKLSARLSEEALDVTLPGRGRGRGGVHPVLRTWQRIEEIWHSLGFEV